MRLTCPVTAVQIENHTPVQTTCMKTLVRQATFAAPIRTDREILNFFEEEQIGVYCEPRCGDCRCGACVLGNKQMSIKEEREYYRFKSLMYLDKCGNKDDPGPYWRTEFPWTIEPDDLVDNKAAVAAVMYATEKKLGRNPEWRETYEQQLHALVEKGFAREISQADIDAWVGRGGKVYFIAHQMVINPDSKSTPVRCCFNSSQKYQGYSLNSSWELGPDLVNSLHSILLRFRKDVVAAQGDITKMYYMVRITEKESWMQIFMWRFVGESRIRYFKMERLVMGNKPSASLSGVALAETAKLEDFPTRFPSAFNALTRDAYVDNVFLTAPDQESIKAMIAEIELVAARGGFFFKPFIISGENVQDIVIGTPIPDTVAVEEEKALGVYWHVSKDLLYIKADLHKSNNRVRRGVPISTVSIGPDSLVSISPHMTLRVCLSLHSKPFDALGFILPTRVIGNLLFRSTLQLMKKERKGKIPWDEVISGQIRDQWNDYFSMLLQLDKIYFPRSLKPEGTDPTVKPALCTFNDGNPDGFGTVGYARWIMADGSVQCRLILSKSRLGPLMHKGETVRNELSGSTLSARLKTWIQRNSDIEFGEFHHFLDSQIVRDMLAKDSYGFNTFIGLRVAEIQQKTVLENWKHVPSRCNISDVLTKGAPPSMLGPGSDWQEGPAWLRGEESTWPVSAQPRRETCAVREALEPFLRKAGTNTICTSQLECFDTLISHCSCLHKLLRCVSYLVRWRLPTRDGLKNYATLRLVRPVSASEISDAMNLMVAWEQKVRLNYRQVEKLVPRTVLRKLNNFDRKVSLVVVGGRVQNFPLSFLGQNEDIPILPYGDLAKLVVEYYHKKYHKEVDTIVAHVRSDFWVVKCRKIASYIDSRCRECKLSRKRRAAQLMGDLPVYRSNIQAAFSVVGCDLWGPIMIRDDVVKRGNRVYKKAWGVLLTCTATRAVYLDVACGSSTEELLHVLRRAMARCGDIKTIISDPGTNLVGAAKELRQWRQGWDEAMLVRHGAKVGLEWVNIMAASQHQNGMSEIMIKLSKAVLKSLMRSIGKQVLSLNELNTLLAETAQLINERPIGMKPNEKVDSAYLSPNSLLLGRSSDRISSGPFWPNLENDDDPRAFKTRFQLVQSIAEQFWRVWVKLYFPSLIIRHKWHAEKRNLKVGDICIVQDSNALRGEWRIARVSNCYPDCHGKVRNVELLVKPKQGGQGDYIPTAPVYIKRHVSKVVVLEPSDSEDSSYGSTPGGARQV